MRYACVIGDLVKSSDSPERWALQGRFQDALDSVNSHSANSIASPGIITLGDEFQLVYRNADSVFRDLVEIRTVLFPAKIRFSIGLGPLSTPINQRMALGMDGPAFHVARHALERTKESGELLLICNYENKVPSWVGSSLSLIALGMQTWKRNRFQVLHLLLEGASPKEVASQLGISTVAVYKNINSGGLHEIRQIFHAISKWVNEDLSI